MGRGKKKYYVVWKGKQPGIFEDWESCKASVSGEKGARYMGFDTLQEAEEALQSDPHKYFKKKEKTDQKKFSGAVPLRDALSVDAACRGNPGVMEYRGVWVDNGEEYFRMGPYDEATVNIGEFLAIVHGLAQLKKDNLDVPVYSDSLTAIKWVRDRKANTKLQRSEVNDRIFEYLERAESWLESNTYTNPVLKWKTAEWGEIPADYGRK